MLGLAELEFEERKAEDRLEERYLRFDQRLREMEEELKLYPYAKLSEIVSWAEKLDSFLRKLKTMREYSLVQSKHDWNRLEQTLFEYVSVDKGFISVITKHVVYLAKLDERYRQRVYVFTTVLDYCVRYLKSYVEDLENQGFSLTGILLESQQLSETNWLSAMK